MIMNFFSSVGLISPIILILFTKNIKSLILGAAKELKLILFLVRSLKSLTPHLLPDFPGNPIFFFKILTTGTKVGIIPNSDGVPDVRD